MGYVTPFLCMLSFLGYDLISKEHTNVACSSQLERDPLHQGLIVQRSHLKSREFQLDLTSRLGKTQVITLNTPLNQQVR